MTTLRLGTRGSRLALAQAETVARALRQALHVDVEIVPLRTDGDRTAAPLTTLGGSGVFVSAVRLALRSREVDLAVHSLKDVPTAPDPTISLVAVPRRGDPRDALVATGGRTLGELPAGATVGTGSPRRAAQLHALGFGLDVVAIRGNVDSRVDRVDRGDVDAVVVAAAGLVRLGWGHKVTETLDPLVMLPAPGQGALAVEAASDGTGLAADVSEVLDDPSTRAAVTAERALLAGLEAGCTAPVGCLADVGEGDDGEELFLRGVVVAVDGSSLVRLSNTGPPGDAFALGADLARKLLDAGAAELLSGVVA